MASLSVHSTIPSPPFMNIPPSPSPSMSGHARRKSRNPVSPPLPSFSFNPGANEEGDQNDSTSDDGVATTSSKKASRPPPLPEFRFNPGAHLPTQDRLSPTHPVLEEMALNSQQASRSAKPSPLPAFTFAPGQSTQGTPSPSRSEFLDVNSGRSHAGHKRAGSEFVGGGGTDGPMLMSTSPSKHEALPVVPSLVATGRRGHAHKRSQAVSISDIDTSELVKAHAISRTRRESGPGSGTTTPSETPSTAYFSVQDSPQRQDLPFRSPPASPNRRESATGARPRVEFAEKIDVIPRPLSLISSETEGSSSTVRYSHSLTNSINSIASPMRLVSSTTTSTLEESPTRRPKSADASVLLASAARLPSRALDELRLPVRPVSAYGSPAATSNDHQSGKRKHFWFSHSPERTPTSTPKNEKSDPLAKLPEFGPAANASTTRPKTSPERSNSRGKKKYHTWTGSLFHKKSKTRGTKQEDGLSRAPPPLQRRTTDQIFDADDTIVLRAESPVLKRSQPRLDTNITPVSAVSDADEYQVTSPVLDLDAALGPFGSDASFGLNTIGRTTASRLSKLHSSERRGVADAFGVIHRRADSAPSMPSFNRSGMGLIRHESNPSLVEDVFDEEEEDNFLADQKEAQDTSEPKRGETMHTASAESKAPAQHKDGLGLTNVADVSDGVVIVDTEENIDGSGDRSSNSTLEPPMITDADMVKRPMSSPVLFAYPSTQSQYASSTEGRTTTSASMISSPDPDHTQFDVPRLVPNNNQLPPEYYLGPSNDDLPSLSDSVSSSAIPRVSSSANTRSSSENRHEQRSNSMFVSGTSRSNQSWKRSSLASLNRLIPGSANGSKLRFETTPDAQSDDKAKRRSNRLSKLVTFWRPKERTDKE